MDICVFAVSNSEALAVQQQYLDYLVSEAEPVLEENIIQMFRNLSTCMRSYRCMLSCCGAGENMFTFAPNGEIYPCARYQDHASYCLGHIDMPKMEMQNIAKEHALMTEMRGRKVAHIEKCQKCAYRRFCEGDCSLATYEAYSGWLHPHPRCDYNRGVYDRLFSCLSQHKELPQKLDAAFLVFDRDFV